MENIKEVYDFYNNGAEIDRLERGLGIVEFYRSKEIISRYINDKSTIYDIKIINQINRERVMKEYRQSATA